MAKERTINEIRQTKEYYTGNDTVKQIMSQQIEEEMKENIKTMKECPLDPVEEAKILIVDKITRQFSDFVFEKVNEEMSKSYVFQSSQYLTQAGYDEFEDEWFEFFHNHHGDIVYEVMNNITK